MFLNEEDLATIKAYASEAEKKTGSMIVPVIAENSDFYESAVWRSVFFGLCLTALTLAILYFTTEIAWRVSPFYWLFFLLSGGLIFGLATIFIPALKRIFAGKGLIEKRVTEKAEVYFLEEEVFNTKARTGILIYLSLFEHQVIVLADSGITKVIDEKDLDTVVEDMTREIRRGNFKAGFKAGIDDVVALLQEKGFSSVESKSEKTD